MLTEFAIMFFVAFIQVALRAFQQLNVVHDNRWAVPPISFGMAACTVVEVMIIAMTLNYLLIIPMGAGGACGCLASMELHRRMRRRIDNE